VCLPTLSFDKTLNFYQSPVFFTFAAIAWKFVDNTNPASPQSLEAFENERPKAGYLSSVVSGFYSFFKATYYGAFLVLSRASYQPYVAVLSENLPPDPDRKFAWLVSGYSLALYGHRYLENGLAPIFAKQVLGTSCKYVVEQVNRVSF